MTAAQLAHLAELAALAADYFAVSDPGIARTFRNSAVCANALSAELHHDETEARHGISRHSRSA
jgi:hypothetical protein